MPGEGIGTQVAWLGDPEVTRFLNSRFDVQDSMSVSAYVASHDNETTFLLGIFDRATGDHIGNHRIEILQDTAWLGVLIGDTNYWGRGVLSETRAAVVDFALNQLGVVLVQGRVAVRNLAVVASYLRLGFKPLTEEASHQVPDGDEFCDSVVFRISKAGWEADNLRVDNPGQAAVDASWFVATALGINIEEVARGDQLGSVRKWDSLGHLELVEALEAELGRELETEEILGAITVEAIGHLLDKGNTRGRTAHEIELGHET